MEPTHPPSYRLVNVAELARPLADRPAVERLPAAAVAVRDGRIAWVGPEASLPTDFADLPAVDAEGRAVLPGLVDGHTHLVFAGDRNDDFAARSAGATYAEVARRGGGIQRTVRATRAATTEALVDGARARLVARARHGITTTECKTGYGLSVAEELRLLEVHRRLAAEGFDLESTLLAAHAVPADSPRDEYVRAVIEELIPAVAARGLARFVDVFVETGAYTVDEARRIFAAGRRHGLVPRLHADQLTAGGGAELAAEVGAASADHLEHVSADGMAKMAAAGVVAVLLPGAWVYLGDAPRRLGRQLVDQGVTVAVATDTNPGSSPTQNLPLMATLAVTQLGLTVDEALWAVTRGGARALRRDDVGGLDVGQRARFVLLDGRDARSLVSSFGEPIVRRVIS